VLRNANRISECLVELEQAVKLGPTSHTFYGDLGAVYLESGHAADAFEALRESMRLHWKSGPNHYNLGFVLERRGDHEQAEAEYAIAYSFGDRLPPRGALIVSF
jgi:tetratricopeptide (TPR) repeat protein